MGQHCQIEEDARPGRMSGGSRATVDGHHEWIALLGVKVARVKQPALHIPSVALPVQALGFAPSSFGILVGMRDLLPGADRPGPDFGRLVEGMADQGGAVAVLRQGYGPRPTTGRERFPTS